MKKTKRYEKNTTLAFYYMTLLKKTFGKWSVFSGKPTGILKPTDILQKNMCFLQKSLFFLKGLFFSEKSTDILKPTDILRKNMCFLQKSLFFLKGLFLSEKSTDILKPTDILRKDMCFLQKSLFFLKGLFFSEKSTDILKPTDILRKNICFIRKSMFVLMISVLSLPLFQFNAHAYQVNTCDYGVSGCYTGSSGYCPQGNCLTENSTAYPYYCAKCSLTGGGPGGGINPSYCTEGTRCYTACYDQYGYDYYKYIDSTSTCGRDTACTSSCNKTCGSCSYTSSGKVYISGTSTLNTTTCTCSSCSGGTFSACAAGYYGNSSSCTQCPSFNGASGTSTSSSSSAITACNVTCANATCDGSGAGDCSWSGNGTYTN